VLAKELSPTAHLAGEGKGLVAGDLRPFALGEGGGECGGDVGVFVIFGGS
jgi:hypothetical protein